MIEMFRFALHCEMQSLITVNTFNKDVPCEYMIRNNKRVNDAGVYLSPYL